MTLSDGHILVGITGGIGSGKSVVSRMLRLKGYDVYDCDSRARDIMESDPEVRRAIVEIVGEEAYQADGSLARPVVAQSIFHDKERLARLNSVVHRAVGEDLDSFASSRRLSFVESAILFSSGLAPRCRQIWLVEAPEALRIERVKARSGLSLSEVQARIAAQSSEFADAKGELIRHIDNSGSTSLLVRVEDLLSELAADV